MRSALLPSGLRPSDAACLRQLAAQLLLHDHEPRSPNSHVERPHPSSNKWVRKGHCACRKYRNAVLALFAPPDSSQDRVVRAAEQRRSNRPCVERLARSDRDGAAPATRRASAKGPTSVMPVTLSDGKINGVRNGTGTGKYRNAVLTLCAPVAALKIVSSETSGSPIFLGCSPTCRHKFTFGSAARSGTPWGTAR